MTKEQSYFLQVISDYIKGVPATAPDEGVVLDALVDIARRQFLTGIVYAQCKTWLPEGNRLTARLQRGFDDTVFYYVCNDAELKELRAAFAEKEIDFLVFKGLAIAQYHRVPQLRTMGDIDILIHPADRRRVHELMLAMGYECTETGDAVWAYRRDVVEVEVHERMIYENLSKDFDYGAYFDHAWEYGEGGSLQPNMQFLYLVAHTAKHILDCGSGFRPFLDMVFMVQAAKIDWQFVTEELEKIHLLRFVQASFALCQRWFGVEMPIACDDIDDAFFEDATKKTFLDGLFGYENEGNFGAHITKELERKGSVDWKTSLLIMWRKLFPKENTMANSKVYTFFFSRKVLRPIAWIIRIIYCAVTKFSQSMKLLIYPFAKRKEIRKRQRFMNDWGL